MINQNLAEYWDKKWTEYNECAPNPFAIKLVEFCKSKNKNIKDLKILDLGCGDGRDSKYFIENNFNVSAIDIAPKSVAKIKELFGDKINVTCQDLKNLQFNNESFNVIYSHLTLHYFTDQETEQIINKIFNLLKKDGVFFIKCKSDKDKLYGEGEKIAEHTFFKGHVRHFFTLDYLKSKLSKFQILEIDEENNSSYNGFDSSFVYAIVKK